MDYYINIDGYEVLVETYRKKITDDIVDALILYRKQHNLTQQNISEMTGIKRANIARIESKRNEASLDSLLRYASCMGLKLNITLDKNIP